MITSAEDIGLQEKALFYEWPQKLLLQKNTHPRGKYNDNPHLSNTFPEYNTAMKTYKRKTYMITCSLEE